MPTGRIQSIAKSTSALVEIQNLEGLEVGSGCRQLRLAASHGSESRVSIAEYSARIETAAGREL